MLKENGGRTKHKTKGPIKKKLGPTAAVAKVVVKGERQAREKKQD